MASSVLSKSRIYPSLEEAPEFQDVMSPPSADEADLAELRRGAILWKLRSCNSWYRRRYWLDEQNLRLLYEPSRKPFWSNAKQYVDLLDMTDARLGWRTDVFNRVGRQSEKERAKDPNRPPLLKEECCFSIVQGRDVSLDLVASDEKTAATWVSGLKALILQIRSLQHHKNDQKWLKLQFNKADKDGSGSLNFDECCQLLLLLNLKMDQVEARKLFDIANVNKRKIKGEQVIDAEEFVQFYQMLLHRPELDSLFQKYSEAGSMSPSGLHQFLVQEQLMKDVDAKFAVDLIRRYEPSPSKDMGRMTLSGFTAFMTSPMNDVLDEERRQVNQDMTQPLSHYYIASSHNTYLTGNQLTSDSSIEAYISAMASGCRCIELDIHDGPDGMPVIYHGKTLTSLLLVRDVLTDVIKPNAFKTNPYPLILSLENHLGQEQQAVLAELISEILGDMLCLEDVSDMEELPSPDQLRNKIIIKAKKFVRTYQLGSTAKKPDKEESETDKTSMPSLESKSSQEPEPVQGKDEIDGQTVSMPVVKPLFDMVNICEAVKFRSLSYSKEHDKCYHMFSLSESKALELIDESAADFIRHTERHLVRIYPAGSRTNSSNYSPFPFWSVGCQIVALNYQTNSKEMRMYRGMFRQNGNCGYVLKPNYLIDKALVKKPQQPHEVLQKHLKIRIISGQNLPKIGESDSSVVDPYVTVKIEGHLADSFSGRTRVIPNNGFNPTWNEVMEVPLKVPEQAVVCFTVKDKQAIGSSRFIGSYTLPVNCINPGYRHVPLMSSSGDPLGAATIFIHTEIKNFV